MRTVMVLNMRIDLRKSLMPRQIAASGRVIASFVGRIDAPHRSPYDAAACDFVAYSMQIAQLLLARSELQVIREVDKMNIDRDPDH
jgi:hypothetical protein